MGRATVVSHTGAALYRVQINYDRSLADALIAQLTAERATVQASLPGLQTAITAATAALATETAKFNVIVLAGDFDAISAAQVPLYQAQIDLSIARNEYNQADLHQISLGRQIATRQTKLPVDHEVDAWCADYNTTLAGAVGTIEVALREAKAPNYIIEPGGVVGVDAVYDDVRDGQLVPTMSQLPGQAFFNYAMLPGAAKWRPRYRTGVVTAVDWAGGTVDVLLDVVTSGHQNLAINQTTNLAAVPVDYMGGGAEFFALDDEVVVRFGGTPPSWSSPTVIGFVHDPVPTWDPYLYDGLVLTWPGTPPHTFTYEGYPLPFWYYGNASPQSQRVFDLTPSPTTNRTVVSYPMWNLPVVEPTWASTIYGRWAGVLVATDSLGAQFTRNVWEPAYTSQGGGFETLDGQLSLGSLWGGTLEYVGSPTPTDTALIWSSPSATQFSTLAWISYWQESGGGPWHTDHTWVDYGFYI